MIDEPDDLRARRARALLLMFSVATFVVTADAVSKALVLARLREHDPVPLLHGLVTLDLTFNAGAAFGVGTSYTAIIALIVCGVIVYIIRTARRLRSLAWTIGLGLLLGGAIGNLGDRLFRAPGPLRGQVVDWINLPHFPWTFNLADASITCAAVIIAILAIRGVRIDGTSPAHAAERLDAPNAAPGPAPGGDLLRGVPPARAATTPRPVSGGAPSRAVGQYDSQYDRHYDYDQTLPPVG
jgi:signal peptidase II